MGQHKVAGKLKKSKHRLKKSAVGTPAITLSPTWPHLEKWIGVAERAVMQIAMYVSGALGSGCKFKEQLLGQDASTQYSTVLCIKYTAAAGGQCR